MSSRADLSFGGEAPQHYGSGSSLTYVWDVATLTWVKETQPGGGVGSAVSIADGSDVAEGTTTDPAWTSGAGTVISLLKKIASAGGSAVSIADGADVAEGTTTDADTVNTVIGRLKKLVTLLSGSIGVTGTFWQATQPVSGTFWQATQPVSGPLTDTQLRASAVPVSGTVTASGPLTDTQLRASAVPVSGTVTTSPPANASTNVAQMAGTAVSMNTGVRDAGTQRVTVATNDSVPVTGAFFQATQPVSGTFWQATQPVSGTFWQATQPVSGTFWQATQPVSGTVGTKTDLTPAAPAAATVGVASAQAVAANASRKGLVLVNASNNRISFGFGATAVLDSGITLYPGGVFEMDEYTFDLGAVNAIASAASSPLSIQEYS